MATAPAARVPAAAPAPAAAAPAKPAAGAPAAGAPTKPAAGAPGAPAPAAGAPGAPKPAGAPAGTALEGDLGGEPGGEPAPSGGVWPDDWREQMVGSDAKMLKRLERYASPQAAINALFAAQNRISSGELKPALKEGASAEEIAAYRAEAGIPEKPADYPMPDGVLFGEDDKPFIDSFLTHMHGINAHPGVVKEALAWYHEDREKQLEALVKQDDEHRIETIEAMTANWGHEAKRNKAMVNALIDEAPPSVAAKIKGARGPEDRALLNDWEVVNWLHSVAFKINPVSTVVPGATGDIGMAIDDEITKWESQMGDKNSDYWGGKTHDKAKAEKNQARLRELYGARDRNKPAK